MVRLYHLDARLSRSCKEDLDEDVHCTILTSYLYRQYGTTDPPGASELDLGTGVSGT